MELEKRVQYLERLVKNLLKQEMPNYEIELIASNDHIELKEKVRQWLTRVRPKKIFEVNFVADGAEYTYCMSFLYEPRSIPLPKNRKR